MNRELTVENLTPRERLVFLASCQLKDRATDGRAPLMRDPEYADECKRLADLGWLQPVRHQGKLAGYRLSPKARNAHSVQELIEQASASVN